MLLKRSYFNCGLFRKNISRNWPMWALLCFLGGLLPLTLLLRITQGLEITPLEMKEAYYGAAAYAVPIISLVYALVTALLVWSYLFQHRSVSMMHSLPIRREGLFVTNFLSGMAIIAIPYAFTAVFLALVSLLGGCFSLSGVLTAVLVTAAESFFYFASATLVAFITANGFALVGVYFLLHFLAVLTDFVVNLFASGFIFGMDSLYSGTVNFLSPTVYFMEHVRVDTVFEQVQIPMEHGEGWHSVLREVTFTGGGIVAAYALVGVALTVLSWLLYRCRRSESAGEVVAVSRLRPVFRWLFALYAALLGGQALYVLVWEIFSRNGRYQPIPMAVCMTVAGCIGYFVGAMIVSKSLRVFRGAWKHVAVIAVACIAVVAVLSLDLLGIASRVPTAEQTVRVELRSEGNSYNLDPVRDAVAFELLRDTHRAIVESADAIENFDVYGDWVYYKEIEEYGAKYAGEDTKADSVNQYDWASFHVVYTLKSGLHVERSYDFPITRAALSDPDSYAARLTELLESREMCRKRLRMDDPAYEVESGYVYGGDLANFREDRELTAEESKELLAAVVRDTDRGAWGKCHWLEDDDTSALSVDFSFRVNRSEGRDYDWICIVVRPEMSETLSCLTRLGILEPGAELALMLMQQLPEDDVRVPVAVQGV